MEGRDRGFGKVSQACKAGALPAELHAHPDYITILEHFRSLRISGRRSLCQDCTGSRPFWSRGLQRKSSFSLVMIAQFCLFRSSEVTQYGLRGFHSLKLGLLEYRDAAHVRIRE